jgi:chromate transport protein ChrA
MLVFIVAHLLAGILLGSIFRIAVMIPAAVIVVIESFLYLRWFDLAPWYWTLVIGLVAVQAGYVVAAILRPSRRTEKTASEQSPPITRISAQE